MGLEQNNEQHYREVPDKFHEPFADYQMTSRDYVLRPYTVAAAITVTLPPVAECKGRFYSIVARACTMTLTITITSKGDDEGWEGDIVMFEIGTATMLYSDGMKWCLRSLSDIEIASSTRGQYNRAAAEISGMTARGGRFCAEARATEIGNLVDADGVHAQGVAYEALFARTVNALYAEAMVKATSTVTTLRGAMITANTEGAGHTITNMIGCHIRTYSVTTPGGYYRTLLLEHEKSGANPGIPLNEYIKIIDSVFTAVQTTAAYGLRMLTTGIITTGISIESQVATGISISTVLTTATGRGIKSACTLTAGNLGDGYGVNEIDLTLAGTAAGHIAAMSSWVNIPTGVVAGVGGNFIAAQTNGVWSDAGATITGGVVITGMVTQGIMGTADPTALCIFSSNISGDVLHAIFYAPAPVASLGYVVDATTDSTKCGDIPIFTTGGTQYWVRVYDASS